MMLRSRYIAWSCGDSARSAAAPPSSPDNVSRIGASAVIGRAAPLSWEEAGASGLALNEISKPTSPASAASITSTLTLAAGIIHAADRCEETSFRDKHLKFPLAGPV